MPETAGVAVPARPPLAEVALALGPLLAVAHLLRLARARLLCEPLAPFKPVIKPVLVNVPCIANCFPRPPLARGQGSLARSPMPIIRLAGCAS